MTATKIKAILQKLTGYSFVELTTRGNTAIQAALTALPKDKGVLIPQEGGWLSYKTAPQELGLEIEEVKCDDARLNLQDLAQKLATGKYGGLLYANPGGYFAEQPVDEIYSLCKKHNCLIILDISGSIGTELADGRYADIIVGSFGKWKPVNAGKGGFVAVNDIKLQKALQDIDVLKDDVMMLKIIQKLEDLPNRIKFLEEARYVVIKDLLKQKFDVVYPNDTGFVVVVKYTDEQEKENKKATSRFKLSDKERVINYCTTNKLEWTQCPRYIRINDNAISIEVKRL